MSEHLSVKSEASTVDYLKTAFEGVTVTTSGAGDWFFTLDPERKFPFATIVTRDDDYDSFSKLSRDEALYRLNVGLTKETFRSLFPDDDDEKKNQAHDFTAFDRLMPHPVYGRMHWVSIVNPTEHTFETTLKKLIAESHDIIAQREGKRAARRDDNNGQE